MDANTAHGARRLDRRTGAAGPLDPARVPSGAGVGRGVGNRDLAALSTLRGCFVAVSLWLRVAPWIHRAGRPLLLRAAGARLGRARARSFSAGALVARDREERAGGAGLGGRTSFRRSLRP